VISWELWPVELSLAGEAGMPSVVGLLEPHELAALRCVYGLREADRIQAELAAAELEWQEWMIACRRVDTVLAPCSAETIGVETTRIRRASTCRRMR
jgi:hypothetical protein